MSASDQARFMVTTRRSPSYMESYSNAVNVRVSSSDMSLVFSRGSVTEAGLPETVEELAVTLSPQTFKMLTLSMLNVLKAYEQGFGEVKILAEPPKSENIAEIVANLIKAGKILPK